MHFSALVIYWAPYYRTEDGGEIGITNLFFVLLKSGTDLAQLEKLAKENSVEMLGADKDIPGWYYLACTNLSRVNALEMANLFYETGLFEESNADFIIKAEFDCINEPWFTNGSLWHLNNLSYPNIDINYCDARAIVPQASSNVTVAIIDEGVQTNHTDLYNVLPGWDAHTGNSPNYVDGSHGTMAAGFIGAIPNNGVGVAGIAYGAKILPISLRLSGIISSGIRFREAFNYAVNNGAKIISCSWWYPYGNDSNLEAGIISALNNGRVVVFSSGNQSNSSVNYPKAIDPRLLVVGAVSQNGSRASFSNYGSALDVVAPGQDLRSTTIQNGHVTGISGTSFAAPQVAGIAALILSKYPDLTQRQVADNIKNSAKRIRPDLYDYDYFEFGRYFNRNVGSGLVDAYEAVKQRVVPDLPVPYFPAPEIEFAGYDNMVDGMYIVNITNYRRGLTYEWITGNGTLMQGVDNSDSIYIRPVVQGNGQMPGSLYVRCKANYRGQSSGWGDFIIIAVR